MTQRNNCQKQNNDHNTYEETIKTTVLNSYDSNVDQGYITVLISISSLRPLGVILFNVYIQKVTCLHKR